VKSKVSCNIKSIINYNRFSENSKLSYEREIITNTLFTFYPKIERPEKENSSDILLSPKRGISIMNTVNSQTCPIRDPFSKIAIEFIQDLLKELLSSKSQLLEHIKFSFLKTIILESINIKRLANLFCQANGTRNRSIIAK